MNGYWNRDLKLDLDAIQKWGRQQSLLWWSRRSWPFFRWSTLGEEVLRRGMLWFHLPIADVSTPDEAFERRWKVAGHEIRALLRGGRGVLAHCRGGLGRADMIGARILIELGMEPTTAIRQVRTVRPGAIETSEQEEYVLSLRSTAC